MSYNTLNGLLENNKPALQWTYLLSLTEHILLLLVPWAIGNAINDLLQNHYQGLVFFVALWLLHTLLGVGRKMYDTRAFMRIYTGLVIQVVGQQRASGIATSVLLGRTALIREIVDFLERDVPEIFSMVISFFGSLLMLLLYEKQVAILALIMLAPVLTLNLLLWKPIQRLNRAINNTLERQAKIVSQGASPGGCHSTSVFCVFCA